jgi:hypothetical protein
MVCALRGVKCVAAARCTHLNASDSLANASCCACYQHLEIGEGLRVQFRSGGSSACRGEQTARALAPCAWKAPSPQPRKPAEQSSHIVMIMFHSATAL